MHDPALIAQCDALRRRAGVEGIDQLAVGAAVVYEGALLIVTRASTEDVFPDHAEIPGGSVDPGEDLLTALGRELLEETGLHIATVHGYTGSFDFRLQDGRLVRQYNFLVQPASVDVVCDPREHSGYHWLDLQDIERLGEMRMTSLMQSAIRDIVCRLDTMQ